MSLRNPPRTASNGSNEAGKYSKVQHSYAYNNEKNHDEKSIENRNPQKQKTRDKVNKQIDELTSGLERSNMKIREKKTQKIHSDTTKIWATHHEVIILEISSYFVSRV